MAKGSPGASSRVETPPKCLAAEPHAWGQGDDQFRGQEVTFSRAHSIYKGKTGIGWITSMITERVFKEVPCPSGGSTRSCQIPFQSFSPILSHPEPPLGWWHGCGTNHHLTFQADPNYPWELSTRTPWSIPPAGERSLDLTGAWICPVPSAGSTQPWRHCSESGHPGISLNNPG